MQQMRIKVLMNAHVSKSLEPERKTSQETKAIMGGAD
jgi:hypothetical protein